MINLVITILIINYFTICFKWFEKYNVDNFTAIIINYITAGILGFILSDSKTSIEFHDLKYILYFGSLIGALFIVVFNLFAYSTQKTGIAITVLTSKLSSIILPVSFVFISQKESPTSIKLIALALAISALFFIIKIKGKNALKKSAFLILIGIFIGQGSADILFNKSEEIISQNHGELYFSVIFLSAGILGYFYSFIQKKQSFIFNKKNLFFGLLLGIPNYFSLVFFFKALAELDTSIAFPVLNIGTILLSTLLGALFYKEKITLKISFGILLAALSLYLITL